MNWLRAPKGMPNWLWFATLIAAPLGGAGAAPPSPGFGGLDELRKPLRGLVRIRVAGDEGTLPGMQFLAIRVDGRQCAVFDHVPYTYRWQTAPLKDGSHVLSLYRLDVHAATDAKLDEITVSLANHPEPPASAPAAPKAAPAVRPAVATPAKPSVPPSTPPSLPPAARSVQVAEPANLPSVMGLGPAVTPASPAVPEANPLGVRASALAMSGRMLLIGRQDGGLTIYDASTHVGRTVPVAPGSGPVCGIAASAQAVYWLCGEGPTLHRFVERTGEHRSFPVTGAAARVEPVRSMVASRGCVVVSDHNWTAVLDAQTGEPAGLDRFLGADAARAVDGTDLLFAADGADTVMVSVSCGADGALATSAWRALGSGAWTHLGERPALSRRVDPVQGGGDSGLLRASAGGSAGIAMALTPRALVSVLDGMVEVRRISAEEGSPVTSPPPSGAWQPGAAGSVTASDQSVWWICGGAVFRYDVASATTDAFLPWNDARDAVTLVADGSSAWVATAAGVRRVAPKQAADPTSGFGGFVRAPMRDDAVVPSAGQAARLASEIAGWRGVPYRWGGATKQGADCSGFVMAVYGAVGVSLPHGSAALPKAAGGLTVRDELRYGDVLCYPGHAAIYTGNGTTAETVSGQGVGSGSIWRRRDVVVRRFLGVESARPALASRHSAKPRTRRRR